MIYSEDVIEDVRSANDIVGVISQYTQLKQKGSNYFGLCPFHRESTPSFSVSPDRQLYHCFGCGASGNVYSFIMQKENHTFPDAIKFLADRVHYHLPEAGFSPEMKKNAETKKLLYEIHTKAARFFYEQLQSPEGKVADDYLRGRGVSDGVRKKFGLGYSSSRNRVFDYLLQEGYDIDVIAQSGLVIPDKRGGYFNRFSGRLMFPIFDVQNKVIGFGGRIMDQGEPKYLNSPDTPIFDKSRNLYGINYARLAKSDYIIIVEGYMDVLAIYQSGIKNVAAALGTAFNAQHVHLLKRYCKNVILLLDSDEAGEKAVLRAIPFLIAEGLNIKVLQLSGAKDPDEFIKKFGKDEFMRTLNENSISHIVFQINCLKKGYNLSDPVQKVQFTKETAGLLAKLPSAIERDVYIRQVSLITDISAESIKQEVDKLTDKDLNQIHETPYKNKPMYISRKDGAKGLDEAKRNIMYAISANPDIAIKVRMHLQKEELANPFYIRLYELICASYDKKQIVYEADIISHFESLEEQKAVSNIFMLKFDYPDRESLLKAINDQLRLIKATYIDQQLLTADVERIQELIDAKTNLKNLYITPLDG